MEPCKAVVVLVHDEIALIDVLHGMLEANGFVVDVVSTAELARARLRLDPVDVVIAAHDRKLGREVRRWATAHVPTIRDRFIFLVDQLAPALDAAAAHARVVRADDLAGLLDATHAMARRRVPTRRAETTGRAGPTPRLLLVEDDPEQLRAIAELLADAGFMVVPAHGGNLAAALLETGGFDVVLSDWCMDDGSGAELHAWVRQHHPALLDRLVFMTGGDLHEAIGHAGAARVMPKGQDSPTLLACLRETATAA